jgi:protein-disulfide isomerase
MAKLFSLGEGKSVISLITSNIGTILLVIAAYILGSLITENRYLKAGGTPSTGTTQQPSAAAPQQPAQPNVTLDQIKKLFTEGNNIKFGDEKRKLLFVEISDPSCPFCHIAAGLNGELNKQVGERFTLVKDGGSYVAPVPEMRKLVDAGKASFVTLYSPGHGNGELGTKAMYCAHEKGKFWQVHDLLMTNTGYDLLNNTVKNDKANAGKLADFLKGAVDPAFLKSCLESGKYDSRIASDTQLAASYGAQGTPGFYVNTKFFAGAYSWAELKADVDAALK